VIRRAIKGELGLGVGRSDYYDLPYATVRDSFMNLTQQPETARRARTRIPPCYGRILGVFRFKSPNWIWSCYKSL